MSFFKKIIGTSALIVFLTGCTGPSPEEKIHIVIESSVKLENSFATKGEPLAKIEEREQVIYNKILEMDTTEFNKLIKLTDEAAQLAEDRRNKIENEQKFMETSKKEFDKVAPLIKKIKEKDVRNTASEMKTVMERRYETYDAIYKAYIEGIDNDIALYELLQKKDLTVEEFKAQVKKNNATYQKVQETNATFNEQTDAFNKLKKKFYEAANINSKE